MRRYVSWTVIGCLAAFIGCDDVIEDDITDDVITTVAPLDNAEINGNTVQFRWNGIEGANEYRLQVNNQATNAIILDSVVDTSIFDYTMDPGNYQWRVRGENFAYTTPYSFDSRFSVVASTNLEGQTVTLDNPTNNEYLNDSEITFTWEAISTATFYKIKISKVEENTETEIYDNNDNKINGISITIGNSVITEDGEYKWEIQAGNDTSETDYFSGTFFIDTQEPPKPTLTAPTTGETADAGEEITFTWTFEDTGVVQSGITGTIQISENENFNEVLNTVSNVSEYKFTFDNPGTYFWRVRGKDDAGTTGDYSDPFQIIIE